MWTQQWPATELKNIDKKARNIVVENGGKHPGGSTVIPFTPRKKGGGALRSIDEKYKGTKTKAVIS